jgi:hypothetical protein
MDDQYRNSTWSDPATPAYHTLPTIPTHHSHHFKVIKLQNTYVSSAFSFSLGRRIYSRPPRSHIRTLVGSHLPFLFSMPPALDLLRHICTLARTIFTLPLPTHHALPQHLPLSTWLPNLLVLRNSRPATPQCPKWTPWLPPSGCRCLKPATWAAT